MELDEAFLLFIQQVEALPKLFLFIPIEHGIYVVQVLIHSYLELIKLIYARSTYISLIILVHDFEHTVTHERKGLNPYDAQWLPVVLMAQSMVHSIRFKPMRKKLLVNVSADYWNLNKIIYIIPSVFCAGVK